MSPSPAIDAGQAPVVLKSCPVCGATRFLYMFHAHGLAYDACENCSLVSYGFHAGQPDRDAYPATVGDCGWIGDEITDTDVQQAECYWKRLADICGLSPASARGEQSSPCAGLASARVLVTAADSGLMVETGRRLGFGGIVAVPYANDALDSVAPGSYDAALVVLAVERARDPMEAVAAIHRALKPDGRLLMVTPVLDSWPARFFHSDWIQYRRENVCLFSTGNVQSALWKAGFRGIVLGEDRPRYTLHHIHSRACSYPRTWTIRAVRRIFQPFPKSLLRKIRIGLPSSACVVTAVKKERRTGKVLSVVMPVYNERATFRECFDLVYAKAVPGVEKEIVIVESNSKDGTREAVREVEKLDGVRVIYQDRPRGKGNAVRAGLKAVTGDIVLIQDADLEYDVDDYDTLIEPITGLKAAFVLGSRHLGHWKMREFDDQPQVAALFNIGHIFFRVLFNRLYGQSLDDPFTMYKVFRTDCLYGLTFVCNRFDFDFEIVIKLVRKGYTPLEVPINYKSRSITEGKKVSILRDPWTWIWALIRFRFVRISLSGEPRQSSDDA